MCGIIGVIAKQGASSKYPLQSLVRELLLLSESRGKEASGIAIASSDAIQVFNAPQPASILLKQHTYTEAIQRANDMNTDPFVCIGHARLVTNGTMEHPYNNQPIIKDGIVGIHNGIIVNDRDLWERHPDLKRAYEVDTEVALSILRSYLRSGLSIDNSLQKLYGSLRGTASMALLFDDRSELVLATNNGSLYMCSNADTSVFFFASELHIAEKIIEKFGVGIGMAQFDIIHVKANEAYTIDPDTLQVRNIQLAAGNHTDEHSVSITAIKKRSIVRLNPSTRVDLASTGLPEAHSVERERQLHTSFGSLYERASARIHSLRRCTRCVLPETMPFIHFDPEGVCNYCKNYAQITYQGADVLKKKLNDLASAGPSRFVVCLSGGRDSSYGLHYFKKILGLDVVAYSYDWGMVTDLARRNQARMCGNLGVEHILVSADIKKKRNNIRLNVLAWLQKPDLGTIPLFMAGDKQYFYYANEVAKQTHAQRIVMSENALERTHFKHGFCNISHSHSDKSPYAMSFSDKTRLAWYYARQFATNRAFLNRSLLDTIDGYRSYYFIPHDYLYLFDYIPWVEEEINTTLIKDYDWEIAEDTKSTWRIGDGTAPFYNYIYYLLAGFTENDTFRSNQIRQGILDRATALELVRRDNQPRYASIDWYCKTISIDTETTLKAIHAMQRLYES